MVDERIRHLPFASAKDFLWRMDRNFLPPEHDRMDPMEYIEKYVMIKDLRDLIIPFRINPVQREYKRIKDAVPMPKTTGKRILVLKARRMGVTTFEQANSYAMCRTRRNTECMTLAQTDKDTRKIFEMVLRMHKYDPNKARLDKDRKDAIAYKDMSSEFSIGTAGSTAVGRGGQLSKVHGSEVAHWDISDSDCDNLTVGLNETARLGEIVYETTANGLGGWFYERWMEASQGKGLWAPVFLGWFLDSRNAVPYTPEELEELIDTLDSEEAWLVQHKGCDPGKLLWRREKVRVGAKLFRQEYPATPEEAFMFSGTAYFDTDVIDKLFRLCATPVHESGGFIVWKFPEKDRRYVIGVDTSEGNESSDDTPICVLDWETGEQVARYNGKLKPHVLGKKSVSVAKMYNGALLAVENNNTGHSVLNTVMNQELYTNVYWHEDPLKEDAKEEGTPGWRTTQKTRPLLLSELDEAIENRYMKVNDKLFLSQCRVFKDSGYGRSEVNRKTGSHGDLVFGWGIAWQARKAKWSSGSITILGE
jgi:hypothetical protein